MCLKLSKKRRGFILAGILFILGVFPVLWASTFLHFLLEGKMRPPDQLDLTTCFASVFGSEAHRALFICFLGLYGISIAALFVMAIVPYHSRTRNLADKIITPVSAGQGQHGTASFLDPKKVDESFTGIELNPEGSTLKTLLREGDFDARDIQFGTERLVPCNQGKSRITDDADKDFPTLAGTVLGMRPGKQGERLYCATEDVHTLCVGATRSGKTRTVVLQTIGVLGLAGESMVLSDPKGELSQYTMPFLERLGYKVVTLDFRSPAKSSRYNYLQVIMDAVDIGDMAAAIDATWDLTSALVGEAKGERIWTDGEAAVIACAIISVVYDNRPLKNPNEPDGLRAAWEEEQDVQRGEWRNLGNVYAFLANMCAAVGDTMPLTAYMARLPDGHPAKSLAAIAKVAPQRTQGSFYTAALATLRLFTNPNIHVMTATSDFHLMDIGCEKTAVFIILPDEKTTYYSLASLFVSQCYEQLVRAADHRGGRLKRRTNFILDEFGNFAPIPDFESKLTVGGGRGIRFTLFLQSFAQLQKKYGDEVARIIRGNCEIWIYLQAEDMETLKEISDKLGNYTVSTFSVSGSHGGTGKTSNSHSMQLTGRALLTVDEVRRNQSAIQSGSFEKPSRHDGCTGHRNHAVQPDVRNGGQGTQSQIARGQRESTANKSRCS